MTKNRFACFILTHKRADRVYTVETLRKSNYTGDIVLVLDDTDKTADEYKKNYPNDKIYIFNKDKAIDLTDSADNTRNPKAVVYARNMTHEIANELGYDYFLVLDDDYTAFSYTSDKNDLFKRKVIKNIDRVFSIYLEFMMNTNTDTLAFAQGGDFIGGAGNNYAKKIMFTRKVMNSFFCKTERPFYFYGLINEDVNMYVLNGSRGHLCFTSTLVQLNQVMTQQNDGGLTTIYLELGTYVKSFYSVMYHPSSVYVHDMGSKNKRIHHRIEKDFTYPMILREEIKYSK
jgi:hypothetical protein